MTTLFIHAGAHRTATSSIQRSLRSWHYSVNRENKIFLCEGQFSKFFTKQLIYSFFVKMRRNPSTNYFNEYIPLTKKIVDSYVGNRDLKKIIVSDEGISGFLDIRFGGEIYPYLNWGGKLALESFDAYKKILVFSIRKLDDFIISGYLQLVKEGITDTFDKYFRYIDPSVLSWRRALEPAIDIWQEAEADVLIVDYDEAIKHNNIIKTFSWIFKEDLPDDLEPAVINSGYSETALFLNRYINELVKDPSTRRTMVRTVGVLLDKKKGYRAPALLNSSEMQILRLNYRRDRAWINKITNKTSMEGVYLCK